MLSKFDDYPIHPTPEPLAHPATTDRNVYDRYWFNGFSTDGEFYFGIALGSYPARGVIDGAFSIVRDGEQHCFRVSGRAPREISETKIGPFRIDILDPMMSLRVVLDDNETGMACDLVFEPRTANIQEGRQTMRQFGRVIMDATRFAQFGRWRGTIRYDGKDLAIDPDRVYATKDRSWGIRPVGEPESGGAPSSELPQIFFTWAPVQWEDHCTHLISFENADGTSWHQEAMSVPAYKSREDIPGVEDPALEVMASLGHQIRWQAGTRRPCGATVSATNIKGIRTDIDLEPLICFRMKGLGYSHPQWGHGRWQGELAIASESWKTADLDEMDFENLHIQQVMRATDGTNTGYGVMENLIIGPYRPYGFDEFLDPAR
ncbi:MAG: hypothetical protein ACI8TX_001047 [Hyphomicrobiaceae bacterium]|jgi:hypothetical protein